MNKTLMLSIAARASGAAQVFRSLSGNVDGLKAKVRQASAQAGQIGEYRTLKRELKGLSGDLERARAEANRLGVAWRDDSAVRTATAAYRTKAEALRRVRGEMKKAGIETKKLASHERELERQAKAATAALQHQATARAGREMRASAASGFLGTAAAAMTLAVPVKLAVDYESAMVDVRKVVDFKTPDGLANLSKQLLAMSTTGRIPLQARELAAIAAAGGQLGVAAQGIPDFTRDAAKMAVAFDMIPRDAGESMAKLSNVFGIPLNQVKNLGDAINHLSDNTAAKAPDMVAALTRVGGTAQQFGLSAVQTAALANSLLAMGRPPEVAATAINGMLGKLGAADKQSKAFQQGLAAIGLSASQMKAMVAKDGQEAITSVLERLKGLDKSDRLGVLTDLFGLEYADDVGALVAGLDNYKKALELTADASAYAGSMEREFANRSATTANQLQLLVNRVQRVGINFGTVLLPALNAGVAVLGGLADAVAWAQETFPILTGALSLAAGGTLAAVIAFKLGRMAALFFGGGLKEIWAMAKLLQVRLAVLRTSTLATAAVQRASALAGRAWALVQAGGAAAANALAAAHARLMAASGASLAALVRHQVGTAALAVKQWAVIAATHAWTAAQWLLNAALTMNPIGLIIAGVAALAAGAYLLITNWDAVAGFFSGLWEGIREKINAFWNWLSGLDLFQAGADLLLSLAQGVLSLITLPHRLVFQGVMAVWDWLKGFSLFEAGTKLLGTLVDGIKSLAMAPVEAVKGIFAKVREYLPFSDAKVGPLSDLTKSGGALVATLGRGVASAGSGALAAPLAGNFSQSLAQAREAAASAPGPRQPLRPPSAAAAPSSTPLGGPAAGGRGPQPSPAPSLPAGPWEAARESLARIASIGGWPIPRGWLGSEDGRPVAGGLGTSLLEMAREALSGLASGSGPAGGGGGEVNINIQQSISAPGADAKGLKGVLDQSREELKRAVEKIVEDMYLRQQRVSLGNAG